MWFLIIIHAIWSVAIVLFMISAYYRGKTKVYREMAKMFQERVNELNEIIRMNEEYAEIAYRIKKEQE